MKKGNKNFREIIENFLAKKKKGETLYILSKKCDISTTNAYRWKDNVPNIVDLYKVAKYIGIPMESIVEEYLK